MQDSTATAVAAIRHIAARMHEIDNNMATLAAAVEEQNVATSEISHNVAGAARGTAHVLGVLDEVSNAASVETVRNASQSVESAIANLRVESKISCKTCVVQPHAEEHRASKAFRSMRLPILRDALLRSAPQDEADRRYAWLAAVLPKAACAAASRAIGTRKGEQET